MSRLVSVAPFGAAVRLAFARLALVVCAAVALGGCSRGQTVRQSSVRPILSDSASARRAAALPVTVGDRVRVKVWREPTLSEDYLVSERGEVVFARLGAVRVAGQSILSLQDTLRARYAEYLRDPAIDVIVFRRIGVQGEVRAPNLYYVDATKTLREVLAEAGGITEAGNPDRVSIVRDGQEVALGRWADGGPLAAELRSGDQILVARRSWLSRNALAAVSTLGLVVSVAVQVVQSRR